MQPSGVSTVERSRSIDPYFSIIDSLVSVCDRRAAVDGEIPATLQQRVSRAFEAFVQAFDALVRTLPPEEAARVGKRVQAAVLPWMRRTENGHRWFAKPRGYAGDYLSISRMYDGVASGDGPVGALIDRCFLELPAARAVVNRRRLVADEIRLAQYRVGDRPARITSLACGPARELFDVFESGFEPLHATLIDFDDEALAHCAAERALLGVEEQLALINANLIHVALGRRTLELAPQDLIYSIGLIDYFDDALVVKLLDFIHASLAPGGRVLLGNFHPRNTTKAVMDHVLDWKLVHRSEADMNALFCASKFGEGCTRILYEPQGINLFAEGVKR